MKLLLDTNTFIWASREPELLSPRARQVVSDPYNQRFVSVVSIWEIQIRHSLGKLPLPGRVGQISELWLSALAAELLAIELRHIGRLDDLPLFHLYPFDRLLIAQAASEGMTVVTPDEAFGSYLTPVCW